MDDLSFLKEHPLLSQRHSIKIEPSFEVNRFNLEIKFHVTMESEGKELSSFTYSTQSMSFDKIILRANRGPADLEKEVDSEIRSTWESMLRKIISIYEDTGMLMTFQDYMEYMIGTYGKIED